MFFSGVCFLFVCQCVCQFVGMFFRTITSERLNLAPSNLAVRYVVQKSHPSSKVKVKGQGHQGQKTKNCSESSPLTVHCRECAVAGPYAARSNRRYHCVPLGGNGLRLWENQCMLSSLFVYL